MPAQTEISGIGIPPQPGAPCVSSGCSSSGLAMTPVELSPITTMAAPRAPRRSILRIGLFCIRFFGWLLMVAS